MRAKAEARKKSQAEGGSKMGRKMTVAKMLAKEEQRITES